MTTVSSMAFVWSRLALAAVLAAGAACAPGVASAAAASADAPRLACCAELPTVLASTCASMGAAPAGPGAVEPGATTGDGRDHDPALVGDDLASAPGRPFELMTRASASAAAPGGDVLAVAPKTSPPRT